MKILHTGDWHIGQLLYGFDRTEDHIYMLNRITEIVAEEKPDLFLLCGDIFHNALPSAASQKLLADHILKIKEAAPDMPIVMIAGNHDSPSRHDVFRNAWKKLGIYTFGTILKEEEDMKNMILEFPGIAKVAAVPFFPERFMPEDYFKRLCSIASEKPFDSALPLILMAHTTVEGCDPHGHNDIDEKYIGGVAAIPLDKLGSEFDYCALGHIHSPQFIRGSKHRVRYSGSPVAVSFDEDYNHSVSIIEIDEERNITCREIGVTPLRPLVSIPSEGFAPLDVCLALLNEFPSSVPAFIRLSVEIEDSLPVYAMQKAREAIEGKCCNICLINGHRSERKTYDSSQPPLTVNEFKESPPIAIARRFAAETGVELSDELEELFNEALESLNNS